MAMASRPKNTVAAIADFASQPPRAQAPPAMPVAPVPVRARQLAVLTRWLACLVFVPSIVILALHRMALLPMFSMGEESSTSQDGTVERIAIPPPEARPSGITTPSTTATDPQGTQAAVAKGALEVSQESPVLRTSSPSVPARPTLLDATPIGESTRAAVPPAATATSSKSVRFLGSLSVLSEPAGARILVDGVAVGVTPLTAWALAAGSHVVRVELDGYQRWSTPIQVITGQTLSLVANLQRAPQD